MARMISYPLLVYSLIIAHVSAYWRMPCMGVAGRGRIDPIVAPNETSTHLHTLKGSNAISAFATTDDLLGSACTSCEIAQDKSSYWSPQMYFYDADNKTFELVQEIQGHITYYKYVPAFTSDGKFVNPIAIPNGMKMLSGNTYRRNFTLPVPDPALPWTGDDATQEALQQKAIGFNCLNYNKAPEGTLQRHSLPDKSFLETQCPDGIRLEVLFPICWNGQDLSSSSPNFTSHVAYSDAGANGGRCPAGYDTVINQLLFETIYPTQNFIGKNGFYALANGDPTGNGYHGDAFIAWEGDTQQQATEQCGSPVSGPGSSGTPSDCPVFNIQSTDAQANCQIGAEPGAGNINVAAPVNALPGDNPIQSGPEPAVPTPTQAPNDPSDPEPVVPPPRPTSSVQEASPSPSAAVSQAVNVAEPRTLTTTAIAASSAIPTTAKPSLPPSATQEVVLSTTTFLANGVLNVLVEDVVVETTTVWEGPGAVPSASSTPAVAARRHLHGRHFHHAHHHYHG